GRAAASVDAIAERKAGTDEAFNLRLSRLFQVDDRHRIRLPHIGVAQAWDLCGAFGRFAFGAVNSFVRRKSERGEGKTGLARVNFIGARNRFVLEHADVGDVRAAPVRRQRERERQAPKLQRSRDPALGEVDSNHAGIGLIEDVEQPALLIESEISRETIVLAILIQIESALARAIGGADHTHAAGVAFRYIKGVFAL